METGEAVRGFTRGDRVFGFADGSYAEFAAIPVGMLARMPKSVDFDEAAALPTPALSAYQIMMHEVMVEAGERVYIHGAGGVIGALAVRLAEWKGAEVVYHAPRGKVDAVVDLVGGELPQALYEMVQQGGVLVSTAGALDEAQLVGRRIRGVRYVLQPNGTQLGVVARLVEAGILEPRLGRVLPLADAGLAQELLHTQGARGKIVLSVSHP
jgi:NADPH:quinone reductase-like Zn-dependent oxidoreductase